MLSANAAGAVAAKGRMGTSPRTTPQANARRPPGGGTRQSNTAAPGMSFAAIDRPLKKPAQNGCRSSSSSAPSSNATGTRSLTPRVKDWNAGKGRLR